MFQLRRALGYDTPNEPRQQVARRDPADIDELGDDPTTESVPRSEVIEPERKTG